MKNLTVLSIVLVFLMMNACTQKVEKIVEKPKVSASEVYAIHELELKADIDTTEFETFVMKELAPIYNKMKGQNLYLVKGDRGIRTDKYAIILTFESIEDRNRIYPPSGEFVGDFGGEAIWDKFSAMAEKGLGESHTDYVKVSH